MPFIKVDFRSDPKKELTNDDIAMLAIKDSENIGPSFCSETPSRVPIFFFGDISGLNASITPLATQVLADTEGDRSCELLTMDKSPVDIPFEELPFTNAAYIRFADKLYYVNKNKEECTQIKKLVNDKLIEFDRALAIRQAKTCRRSLNQDELKKICELTGHIHDNLRPIFIYRDPNAFNGLYYSSCGKKLLEKQSETIAKEMQQQLLNGPFVMVAYSYSAFLTAEVMQYFSERGIPCFLYVIDAPAPEVSQKFLQSQSADEALYTNTDVYAKTILDILNYSARLCRVEEITKLDKKTINHIKNLPPAECLEALAQIIYKRPTHKNIDIFQKLINYEKLCLDKMMNYRKAFHKPFKGAIEALLTKETKEKYQSISTRDTPRPKEKDDPFCGWQGYAETVEFVGYKQNSKGELIEDDNADDAALLRLTHQDVVSNTKLLSKSILSFFNRNLTTYNLTAHRYAAFAELFQDISKGEPELADVRQQFFKFLQRKYPSPSSSSTNSPATQSPVTNHRTESTANIFATMQVKTENLTKLNEIAQPAINQTISSQEQTATTELEDHAAPQQGYRLKM